MRIEYVRSQEVERVQRLCLYPHLDREEWQAWRRHCTMFQESLQGMLDYMSTHAARVHAHSGSEAMQAKVQRTIFSTCVRSAHIPEFRDATIAVHRRYTELDRALQAYSSYHPLSLTRFEPANSTERFYWLQQLQLSYPIALFKVPVGGALGVLVWVLKRDADSIRDGDSEELQAARELVQPLIPQAI